MIFIIVEQALAIAVVKLEEKILVLFLKQSHGKVDDYVATAKVASRHDGYAAGKTAVVAHYLCAELAPTAVVYNVAVVLSVDYRGP